MKRGRRRLVAFGAVGLMVALAVLWPIASARATFTIRTRQINDVNYASLVDIATYYGLAAKVNGRTYTLQSATRKLELTLDQREAQVNGVTVDFAFAPTLAGGKLWLAERDLTTVVDPLFRTWALPRKQIRRIVIDPGHGGKDCGCQGKEYDEKDEVLLVALRLKRQLESVGYTVALTRSNDTFIELPDRPTIARKWKADLFVSLHMNAAADTGACGIETWYLCPTGMPASQRTAVINSPVPSNAYDGLNCRLAFDIQRTITAATGAVDRGIKRQRFKVLETTPGPAVLVELGFLSNRPEERKLGSARYQEQLALGIAQGIINFTKATAPADPAAGK